MITTILFIIGIYLWIISGILGYGIIFYYLEQTNPPYTLGELCYNKSIARICLITGAFGLIYAVIEAKRRPFGIHLLYKTEHI